MFKYRTGEIVPPIILRTKCAGKTMFPGDFKLPVLLRLFPALSAIELRR